MVREQQLQEEHPLVNNKPTTTTPTTTSTTTTSTTTTGPFTDSVTSDGQGARAPGGAPTRK